MPVFRQAMHAYVVIVTENMGPYLKVVVIWLAPEMLHRFAEEDGRTMYTGL